MEPTIPAWLDELDGALSDIRRFWQHRGLGRRFFDALGVEVELGTLRALGAVADADEPSVGDVAASLRVDASTASRLVEGAVTAGYVLRRPSTQDRRRVSLALTEAGQALLAHTLEVRRQLLRDVTAGWPEEDVATLARLLRRLARDVDELTT